MQRSQVESPAADTDSGVQQCNQQQPVAGWRRDKQLGKPAVCAAQQRDTRPGRQWPGLYGLRGATNRLDALQVGLPIHGSPLHRAPLTKRVVTRGAAHGDFPPVALISVNRHDDHTSDGCYSSPAK